MSDSAAESATSPNRRAPAPGWLRAMLVASVLVPALLFAAAAWHDRAALFRQALDGAGSTVATLQEHALKVLETHELLIEDVDDRIRGLSWDAIQDQPEIHDYLAALVAAQVYGFARSAGGQVKIRSALERGTTVRLYLPRSTDPPRAADTSPHAEMLRPAADGETVLVVEDDEDVRAIAIENLTELGYAVLTAADGAAALERLRPPGRIDILFSDVVMPGGMNGAQLAIAAQRLRPGLKVLLTSGYTAAALTSEHGLPEDVPLLGKPYRREELASKLRLVLGGR